MSTLIQVLYNHTGSYSIAIILFTLLTKIILLPISLWAQRNSIKMVELTPELNRLKIDRYGDKDAIAEGTQELYKKRGYHPLVSLVPMLIQLALLFGVIGAVRKLLAGTDSGLSVYPSQQGGITLLMPLAAGLSALLLGLAQNRLNPLQREQAPAAQWSTNGLSIAISLILGAFVPVGVGIYWIASNLLSILQQLLLNAIMPAKKYVDYDALEKSKRELAQIEGLSAGISKEDKRREKADYKRFFSVANKHLVFYSEKSGFYKYFQDVIEYLLAHSNVIIHYVTSDPKDQIFELAKAQPRIRPYYIGEKRLITLMMKMDADMVVMTMPDLENFHIKRSYVRKDVEYVYMFHGVISGMRTLRPKALDHYDTILTGGDYIEKEIRLLEKKNHTREKKLVPCGYGVIDNMAKAYEKIQEQSNSQKHNYPHILIAPSWQESNILESCLHDFSKALLKAGYDVTVRPHPQYLKRFPAKFSDIVESCNDLTSEHFRFETDFSSSETVFTADLLVTDWSGIGYEYALATRNPVLFINTPMKVTNPECADWDSFDLKMRKVMGLTLIPEEIARTGVQTAQYLMENREKYIDVIDRVRKEHIYHFGESGKYGAQYIIHALQLRGQNSLGGKNS